MKRPEREGGDVVGREYDVAMKLAANLDQSFLVRLIRRFKK